MDLISNTECGGDQLAIHPLTKNPVLVFSFPHFRSVGAEALSEEL